MNKFTNKANISLGELSQYKCENMQDNNEHFCYTTNIRQIYHSVITE